MRYSVDVPKSIASNSIVNVLQMGSNAGLNVFVLNVLIKMGLSSKSILPKWWPTTNILITSKVSLRLCPIGDAPARRLNARKNTANVLAVVINVLSSVDAKIAQMDIPKMKMENNYKLLSIKTTPWVLRCPLDSSWILLINIYQSSSDSFISTSLKVTDLPEFYSRLLFSIDAVLLDWFISLGIMFITRILFLDISCIPLSFYCINSSFLILDSILESMILY